MVELHNISSGKKNKFFGDHLRKKKSKKTKQGRKNVTELRPCSFGNERDTGE